MFVAPRRFADHRRLLVAAAGLVGLILALAVPRTAQAFAWGGRNPAANVSVGQPTACAGSGQSQTCLAASVAVLDRSRRAVGLGPYVLPQNFASLTAAEQIFVLTDLDRRAAGLAPFVGLSSGLDAAASAGVAGNTDPSVGLSRTLMGFVSNWAGGDANALLAYQAWMYDDGLHSGNLDCTSAQSSGCWGHRHNVLVATGSQQWVMGAAAGGSGSGASYAMIAADVTGSPGPLLYTWAQAQRAGAGG